MGMVVVGVIDPLVLVFPEVVPPQVVVPEVFPPQVVVLV